MSNGGEVATSCPPPLALLLGRNKKTFPPKHVLSLTPLTSLGAPQFPLPAKQLCWTHAATQISLPGSTSSWSGALPGFLGSRGEKPLPHVCYLDEPLGRG